MKIIKYLNTFAIGLPIILAILSLVNEKYIGTALVSTILTGLIQVILGLLLLYHNPENKYLQTYIITVVLFFFIWYYNVNIIYTELLTYILYPIPLILAIYLSFIIYKRKTL
ncbi:hypothetical protein [Flavobacterium sp.]|uniref:hypothetical protein n=1 Tax=Flavobacterium sp. TaxID=239 RepID=UPI003751B2EA